MKASQMTLEEIIAEEIREFKGSEQFKTMCKAEGYYKNRSGVQEKKVELSGRSNTKNEHPILRKLIKQKVDYLLSKDFTVSSENTSYVEALNDLFDDFCRDVIGATTENAIKHGIAFLQPYFKDNELHFMNIPATQIVPLWTDEAHDEMNGFIRFYEQIVYEGRSKKIYTKAEYWDKTGVKYFISRDGYKYVPDVEKGIESSHFSVNKVPYNWSQVPLTWVKYDKNELPLAYWLFTLIDDYNWQDSISSDVLKDIEMCVYIVKGYDGANLKELTSKLRQYRAIMIDEGGGVERSQATLDINATMQKIKKQHDDIYDYGNGVDTKDPNLGNSSGVAIKFRYTDLDNDCTNLAKNLNLMFAQLKTFIDYHFFITGKGDFAKEKFSVVFNMDMPINETEIIDNIRNSEGIISKRTQVEQHPYVKNVDEELERLDEEYEKTLLDSDVYKDAYEEQ